MFTILRKMLDDQEAGIIREITVIDYNMTSDTPLRVEYFDNGGNYHRIGINRQHRLVTYEV